MYLCYRFCCTKCIKAGLDKNVATWTSGYTTVLFRAYYGVDTDEDGQNWIGGWIQMKIFAQQCIRCDEYITGELVDKGPEYLVKWLHRWIANQFYHIQMYNAPYRGKRTDKKHLINRCEACAAGWCRYQKT